MNWEAVIGMEVHVELNTRSKMFCSCSADYFGKSPNTHTCPICLGLPGALPFINAEAIEKCLKIGLALNCTQNESPYFERKNYFYPDLAKGYQISQLVKPLNINGWITVKDKSGEDRKIRINRAHQEEDTGKLTHQGGETLIDFNRSGVPLVEIVTEPDFRDTMEIKDYGKKLQQIFRDLGVSNADMEKGDMRLEANISVRKVGEKLPNYRIELKNINSFNFMGAAVEYEIKRQIEALEKGETLRQETRGWNEAKKETYIQRVKEEANDYRYFPEPDLPVLKIESGQVENLRSGLPKLSSQLVGELVERYGISNSTAQTLFSKNLIETLEKLLESDLEPKQIINYLINTPTTQLPELAEIIEVIKNKKSAGLDDSEIKKIVQEVLEENQNLVDQYKAGKESVINALIGAVMKKSQGKANADKARSILLQMME